MNNKTWELEKKISSLLNDSGLPVENVYYMMKALTSQLEIMLYQIELTNLTDPSAFNPKPTVVNIETDADGDIKTSIKEETENEYTNTESSEYSGGISND